MQIDTWNREKMDLVSGEPFVPGPLPRNSWAPPGATYSGLLECPLTTRVTKVFDSDASLQTTGSCKINTTFADECYSNAKAVIGKAAHRNISRGQDRWYGRRRACRSVGRREQQRWRSRRGDKRRSTRVLSRALQ